MTKQKKILLVVAMLITVMSGMFFGCAKDTIEDASNPFLEMKGADPDEKAKAVHADGIGLPGTYTAESTKLVFQVNSMRDGEYQEGYDAEDLDTEGETHLVVVEVYVENVGERDYMLSTITDFNMLDELGNIYFPTYAAEIAALEEVTLKPGESCTGELAFQVLDDAERIVLQITPNAFNSTVVLVKLYDD